MTRVAQKHMILRYFELAALRHSSHFVFVHSSVQNHEDHKKFALALHLQVKEALCMKFLVSLAAFKIHYYYKTIES